MCSWLYHNCCALPMLIMNVHRQYLALVQLIFILQGDQASRVLRSHVSALCSIPVSFPAVLVTYVKARVVGAHSEPLALAGGVDTSSAVAPVLLHL